MGCGIGLGQCVTHHEVHRWPSPELAPAAHEWHSTLPLSMDSRPAGHETQTSPPKLAPSPSAASFARSVTKEPAGQVLHCAAPSTPLKVPNGHGRHWSSLTAPGSERYVPMGHELQSPMSHEKQLSMGSHVPY